MTGEEKPLTKKQAHILGNHLAEYNSDETWNQICTHITEDDDENTTIWEPFEYWDRKELIKHMASLL